MSSDGGEDDDDSDPGYPQQSASDFPFPQLCIAYECGCGAFAVMHQDLCPEYTQRAAACLPFHVRRACFGCVLAAPPPAYAPPPPQDGAAPPPYVAPAAPVWLDALFAAHADPGLAGDYLVPTLARPRRRVPAVELGPDEGAGALLVPFRSSDYAQRELLAGAFTDGVYGADFPPERIGDADYEREYDRGRAEGERARQAFARVRA